MSSLADLLFDSDASPDQPLVHWRDRTWTRGEIADAAQRLADTLVRMGAAPDSAVAALVPSTPLGIVILFGVWRAGAVAAPVAPARPGTGGEPGAEPGLELPSDPDLDRLVADVLPSVVVRPSLDEASLVPQVVVRPGEARHYRDAVTLITGESGASAAPRRVMLTRDGVQASVASASGTVRGAGVQLVPVPLASVAGIDAALVAVGSGGAVVLLDPCTPGEYADAVRRLRVEWAMATAELVAALADDPGLTSLAPLHALRRVDVPVAADEARRFRSRFGITVVGGYARPELGGEVVGWTVGDVAVHGDVKLGSVGRPYPGVEVRILGPDRTEVAAGGSGEMWIRSPFAMAGYVSDRLEPGIRFDDRGFVHTGDHGHLDPDGFVWIDRRSAGGGEVPGG